MKFKQNTFQFMRSRLQKIGVHSLHKLHKSVLKIKVSWFPERNQRIKVTCLGPEINFNKM